MTLTIDGQAVTICNPCYVLCASPEAIVRLERSDVLVYTLRRLGLRPIGDSETDALLFDIWTLGWYGPRELGKELTPPATEMYVQQRIEAEYARRTGRPWGQDFGGWKGAPA